MLAHEGEELVEQVQPGLDEVIRTNSIQYSLVSAGILLLLVVLVVLFKGKNEKLKYLFFGIIALVVLVNTSYLSFSTIYLNQQSTTGGPVHWHADFEIYNCGQKVEIKNPEGFSNKVGTEVVHEHNDNRIHIEGVILDKHDAGIRHFIEAIGGELHKDQIAIPTENGLLQLENGQMCSNQVGVLQVFVYKQSLPSGDGRTEGDYFSQQKLTDSPENYIISPFGQVPPGDCIIIEFDRPKEKTEKLCAFYQIAKEKGEIDVR